MIFTHVGEPFYLYLRFSNRQDEKHTESLLSLSGKGKQGSVARLLVRSGLVIEKMSWKEGRLEEVIIKSTIGGNLRVRSRDELLFSQGNLKEGAFNENPLSLQQRISRPMTGEKTSLKGMNLHKVYGYACPTQAGDI